MRYLFFLAIYFSSLFADAHVFVYHRFGDSRHLSTNTSIKELRQQFDYLKQNNYKVVPLQTIINKLQKKEPIPNNWVSITIDDSFKSFYKNGLDIFKEYGYAFTILVYVKATQDHYGDFLSWKELKEIKKYGDVQLHSFSHGHLTKFSKESLIKDTQEGIKIFEKNMGYKPTIYAYPYGEYNENTLKTLETFGFDAILNQNIGSVNKNSNPLDLNRIAMVGKVNIKEKLKYTTLQAKWIEPKFYPKDKILKNIKVEVNPSIKNLKLYITGYSWRNIKVNDGIIDLNINQPLKNSRTRIIIGTDYYNISTKLIIKN